MMIDRRHRVVRLQSRRWLLATIVVVQGLCAIFFVAEILLSVLGLPFAPLSWHLHELVELAAAFGLLLGVALGGWALHAAHARSHAAEQALRAASGAFMEVVRDRFDDWRLTPAERDVAMFALKGFTIVEIARLRNTSEGTVKSQTNAIYRKAGVSGRNQLLSLFVDDLMEDSLADTSGRQSE